MSNIPLKINFINNASIFAKKNFKAIIVLATVLFIFLLLIFFYKDLQEKKNIKIAEQYTQAKILITQKKTNESKLLLENLVETNHKFYSPLSLYLMIDNNLENNSKKIINFFSIILNNNSIDEENLNLIKIKKAIYLISLDEEISAVETLNQIVDSNSVWRNLAISLIIEHYLSKNQKDKAEKYIQLLKNNNNK
jgi:predicted negative regulator of RcsB-dependent stress response|tara:strand:+ start:78 stop:659 length:582 start_codon:yes stop_codon:yes gene_type:complete